MTQRLSCEFLLIRYVPDVVKGEFINIGVILREVLLDQTQVGERIGDGQMHVRFMIDWQRIKAIDPHADIDLLNSLDAELTAKLSVDDDSGIAGTELLKSFCDALSNAIQITDPKPCYAESVSQELDLLVKLYLDPACVEA